MSEFRDNFNRADGALGANWTKLFNAFASPTIVSNGAQPADDTHAAIAFWNTTESFNKNQYSEAQLQAFGTATDGVSFGVIIRAPNDQETCYIFIARPTGSALTSGIFKRLFGIDTQLASEAATTWVVGDTLRAEGIGTNLRLYRNGASLLTVVDSALTGGQPGIYVSPGDVGPASVAVIDSWIAADFVLIDYSPFPKPPIAEAAARGEM